MANDWLEQVDIFVGVESIRITRLDGQRTLILHWPESAGVVNRQIKCCIKDTPDE